LLADEDYLNEQNTDVNSVLNDKKITVKPVCTNAKIKEINTDSSSSVLIDINFPTPTGYEECQVTKVITPVKKRKLDICVCTTVKQDKKDNKRKSSR
jgi:response regulator RpfG family c-di-GMP phosphodiesterase